MYLNIDLLNVTLPLMTLYMQKVEKNDNKTLHPIGSWELFPKNIYPPTTYFHMDTFYPVA